MRSSREFSGGASGYVGDRAELQRQGLLVLHEFEIDRGQRWRRSVFNRESEIISMTTQIQIGVAPGVELR